MHLRKHKLPTIVSLPNGGRSAVSKVLSVALALALIAPVAPFVGPVDASAVSADGDQGVAVAFEQSVDDVSLSAYADSVAAEEDIHDDGESSTSSSGEVLSEAPLPDADAAETDTFTENTVGQPSDTEGVTQAVEQEVNIDAAALPESLTVEPFSLTPSSALVDQRAVAFNLNELWEAQQGGTSASFAITTGGTYALTADLSVNASITVDAPGQDVVIDLGAYTLDVGQLSANYFLRAVKAKSLTIVGDRPYGTSEDAEETSAQIVLIAGRPSRAIESSCDQLNVRNVGIKLAAHDRHTQLEDLGTIGVYLSGGSASLDNCSIFIDHRSQALQNGLSTSTKNFPSAVYTTSDAKALTVTASFLTVLGSAASARKVGEPYSEKTCDNAYGIYVEGSVPVVVEGGAITVDSPQGNATGVLGNSVTISPLAVPDTALAAATSSEEKRALQALTTLTVVVDGSERAYGLKTHAEEGLILDAPLSFSVGELLGPTFAGAVVTTQDAGIVLGSHFAGNEITVLHGSEGAWSNGNGARFARFGASFSQAQQTTAARSFSNGVEESACVIAADGAGLFFRVDEASAPAIRIAEDGTITPCATLAEALRTQTATETVQLRKDMGDVVIDGSQSSQKTSGRVLSLDLNGHSIGALKVDTDEPVRVFSTGSRGAIDGCWLDEQACVSYLGSGDFTMEHVDVAAVSAANAVIGLRLAGSGTVALQDITAVAVAQAGTARAVYQPTGKSLVRASNCSFSAYSDAPGVNVYGFSSSSAVAEVQLIDCSVVAQSFNGVTYGVECAGVLSIQGYVGQPSEIKAMTEQEATAASVRLAANDARADLSNVSLWATCEDDAGDGAYWCLMAGAAYPTVRVQWTLDGACFLKSSQDTHIGYKGSPVVLGDSFAPVVAGRTAKIQVLGTDLLRHEAVACVNDSQATTALSQFCAVAGSAYDGWDFRISDSNALQWRHDAMVRNATTKAEYASLRDAVNDAQAGARLELMVDCEEEGPLTIGVPLTLDLNGHCLTIAVPSRSITTTCTVLDLKASGAYTVANGTLRVVLAPSSSVLTRGFTATAMKPASGVSLVLNKARLVVSASASEAGDGDAKVRGIAATSTTVKLQNGSSVEIETSGAQPFAAQGIVFSGSSNEAPLSIDPTSSVVVHNEAGRRVLGDVMFPSEYHAVSQPNLMRVYLPEDSPLRIELEETFRASALFDSAADAEGRMYDAELYYATSLTTDDDAYAWAFSDQISPADRGSAQAIRPSLFYFQTRYDKVPEAQALVIQGAAPAVTVAGRILAQAPEGEAAAMTVSLAQKDDQKGSERVTVEGSASVAAEASSEDYRKRGDKLDLRTVLGFKNAKIVTYPSSLSTYFEVTWTTPEALSITGTNADTVKVDDAASIEGARKEKSPEVAAALGGGAPLFIEPFAGTVDSSARKPTEPESLRPENATVSFVNMRDESGRVQPSQQYTVRYGEKLEVCGAIPQPADYERNGITYRFVGWSLNQSGSGQQIWNPETIGEKLTLDADAGALAGPITLTAAYAPIAPGQVLVRFLVDEFVEAASVTASSVPTYRMAVKSSQRTVPAKVRTSSGESYIFKGWQPAGEEAVYAGTLPRASADSTYRAVFATALTSVTAKYYRWEQRETGPVYGYLPVATTYGASAQEAADSVLKKGETLYTADTVYTFAGWAPRRSDKVPCWKGELPVISPSRTSFFAVYDVRDRKIPVTFCVDGQTYAVADGVIGSATVNQAFTATGAEKPADISETLRFRGWSLDPSGEPLIMGSVKTLAELTEAEAPITLYASYGAATAEEETPILMETGTPSKKTPSAPTLTPNKGALPPSPGLAPKAAVPVAATGVPEANEAVPVTEATAEAAPEDGTAVEGESGGSAWDWSEPESSGNALVTLVLFVACLIGAAGWWMYGAWRNRKLDEEDDFFDVSALGVRGEQVVF